MAISTIRHNPFKWQSLQNISFFFLYNFGSSLLKYRMSQTTLNLPFLSAWILEDGNLYFQWVCKQERRAWNLATQGRYNAYSNINDKVSVMTEMTNDNMHINKHQTTFNHCPIFIVMLKDNAIFKCSTSQRRCDCHQTTSIS